MISKRYNMLDASDYFNTDLTQPKKYGGTQILLKPEVIAALKKAEDTLPPNYSFQILYGYRSLQEQTNIVKQTEEELKDHPDKDTLLKTYTGGYEELSLTTFSHNNHRSGYALDITLLRNNKNIDLGGQKMDKTDSLSYYQNKHSLSKKEQTIKHNREILSKALSTYGFENNPDEWWHWGYKP